MKYIMIVIVSIWLISCSTEYPAPMPPSAVNGTANNQTIDQNTVISLRNGSSLTLRFTIILPNGLDDIRVEASGINA